MTVDVVDRKEFSRRRAASQPSFAVLLAPLEELIRVPRVSLRDAWKRRRDLTSANACFEVSI